jgi:hypothetical protein
VQHSDDSENDEPIGTAFDDRVRSTIREALSNSKLQEAGLHVVHFMSATQEPRNKITSTGVRGDAEALDAREGSRNILLSLRIRDFLGRALDYRSAVLWKWIALVPGLDITALLFRNEIIGATIGFYFEHENVYLTHVTAAHRGLQGGAGIGLFLRKQQLGQLTQRLDPRGGPLQVISLSANPDEDNRGAVHFQRHVFTTKLGYEELLGGLPIIMRIAAAKPELLLDRIMQQDVTPLLFRKLPTGP